MVGGRAEAVDLDHQVDAAVEQIGDHVDRGGCIIEGPVENIDARLEKQLDILHDALRESSIEGISDARDSTGDNLDE